jgi:hypothetical protein
LKSTIGASRASRSSSSVKPKACNRRRCALLADLLARLDGGLIAPDDLPATGSALQRAAKFLAVGGHLPHWRGAAHRRLERDVDHLAGETLEILLAAQGPVNARRRHFKPLVFNSVDFQRKLQLARDFFAVFDVDELLGTPACQGRSIVMRNRPPAERSISTSS